MSILKKSGLCFIISASAVLFSFLQAYAASDVEGYWKSIDDKTKEATAYWRLEVKDNILYGYIVSFPNMKPDDACTKCKGEMKDKPTIGTPWIKLTKKNDKNEWEDGYIIDPGKGKQYRAKIWIENGKLKLRGYIAFVYQTQEWLSATQSEAENGF